MTAYTFSDGGFPAAPSTDDTLNMGGSSYVFTNGAWRILSSGNRNLPERKEIVAEGGQTVIDNLNYAVGTMEANVGGFLMASGDITATNGTSVTFTKPLVAGQVVQLIFSKSASTVNDAVEDAEILSLISI